MKPTVTTNSDSVVIDDDFNITGDAAALTHVNISGGIVTTGTVKMMRIMLQVFVAAVFLFGLCAGASATDINYWTPVGGSTNWNVAGNWSLGHVPYNNPANYNDPLNEEAKMNGATGTCPVIGTGSTVDAFRIFVGSSVYGELTINGGTVTTSGYITSGNLATDVALITMSSGTVRIGLPAGANGHFYCGRYGTTTFNMSGGDFTIINNLNIGQYAGSYGTVNLSGGTLTANNLVHTGTALIDITGSGKLVLIGDDTATVATWISSGWMTANGNNYEIHYDYNITNPGKTTVWAGTGETMHWRSDFNQIALENIGNRDHVSQGSSSAVLCLNGDVELTADTTAAAQLTHTTSGDTLVTEYKLTFDGDGDPNTGGETVDWTPYNDFLTTPSDVMYFPGDGNVEVTLWVRASNAAGTLADAGTYTATQTLTAHWK